MNTENRITPHETFDLHELLNLKVSCAIKSSTIGKLVKDENLKSILQNNFATTQEHIRELQSLIQSSILVPTDSEKEDK